MASKRNLKTVKPKKERESKLLKFPELQELVNEELWRYIFENHSSYSKIAQMTEVSKARFSELKLRDSTGSFTHPLSQSVLDPLIGRGIVSLDKIEKHLDISDPKKAQWLARKKLDQEIELLQGRNVPIVERIQELIDTLKKEAGLN